MFSLESCIAGEDSDTNVHISSCFDLEEQALPPPPPPPKCAYIIHIRSLMKEYEEKATICMPNVFAIGTLS